MQSHFKIGEGDPTRLKLTKFLTRLMASAEQTRESPVLIALAAIARPNQ